LAGNLLVFGYLRNIQFLWQKNASRSDFHPVDPSVAKAIQSSQRIYIANTHWEVLYWNFMRWNPAARFSSGTALLLPSPDTLMLLPVMPRFSSGLLPVRLPANSASGLTYIGEADHEHIFAQGDTIGKRYADRSRYTLIQAGWQRNANGAVAGAPTVLCCVGLRPSDGVTFRYELHGAGKSLARPWMSPGQQDTDTSARDLDVYDSVILETRDANDPDQIMRTVYALNEPAYAFGGNELAYSGSIGPSIEVRIPNLRRETYELNGKHHTVSWVSAETPFSVLNRGDKLSAILEIQLAVAGPTHTAALQSNGQAIGSQVTVNKMFWTAGAETARFSVTLVPGENKFVLSSRESADRLPDGRFVCFLLVGEPKVVPMAAIAPARTGVSTH
jgi:hypothetical protein